MTDAALSPAPARRRGSQTRVLFAAAIFTSAALVFTVQPMVTKLVLPMLGGSPSVWNTSMVFFQAALLVGYAYAHGLQRMGSLKAQAGVHLALLLVAALFLPLRISGLLGDPDPNAPIVWLLATLALSVGAPFAVLSATAPLMQAWFARLRAGHADGANPYVLYAASNLGSFLALLAYPILIEPLTALSGQRWGWSGGYGLFVVMVAVLGVAIWRRREIAASAPAGLAASPPIPWREKGVLVLLAAAPSSLMLGVTAHLSVDVASAPFLWVAPLALYLLTFVIAFSARPVIPFETTLVLSAALGAAVVSMAAFKTGEWVVLFGMHLLAFFFIALLCHQRLAQRRPAPDRLTEFFLLLSLGGVVGGAFNALLAPVLFNTVWEYPLVLVLVGLARPWDKGPLSRVEIAAIALGAVIILTPPIALEIIRYQPDIRAVLSNQALIHISQLVFGLGAICAFLVRDRAPVFTLMLAMLTASAHHIPRGYEWNLSERSFFGVMRVATTYDARLGGDVHVLMHGTTLHGAQPTSPVSRCSPTLYYATGTPLGQAALKIQERRPNGANIGVVGQGSGAMAAYKRAEDRLTFFEIDPMMDRLSRDPRWFTFISDCADGPVRTVLGDARLTLNKESAGSYDLLVIDAFSSDAVPTHLLTTEAIAGYLRLLRPEGAVVLHLSNRNLEITLPASSAARALNAPSLHQVFIEDPAQPDMSEASTEALVIAPTQAGLAPFRADPRWRELQPTEVRPWTDDYVNLFGSLVRQMRYAAG